MKPALSSERGLRTPGAAGATMGMPNLRHLGFLLESGIDWSPVCWMPHQQRARWELQVTLEEAGLGMELWQAGKKHLGPCLVQAGAAPSGRPAAPPRGQSSKLRVLPLCPDLQHPGMLATCPASRPPWAPLAPASSRPSSHLPKD